MPCFCGGNHLAKDCPANQLPQKHGDRIYQAWDTPPCIWCGDRNHSVKTCFRTIPNRPGNFYQIMEKEGCLDKAIAYIMYWQGEGGAVKMRLQGGNFRALPGGNPRGPPPQRPGHRGPPTQEPGDLGSPPVSSFEDNNPHSVLHYPPPGKTQLGDPSKGKNWTLPDLKEMDPSELSLSVKDAKYPLRKNFFPTPSGMPGGPMLTNHFEYNIKVGKLYEYQVTDIKEKDRRKSKSIFNLAIDKMPCLASNRSKFATNSLDTIVAWEKLEQNMEPGHSAPIQSITFGGKTYDLRLGYITAHNISDLQGYSLGREDCRHVNVEIISKCLNIILSKRFDPAKVYQQSSNKFFVKKARNALCFGGSGLSSQSLEIMRGYYYNIKEGMGNIILNFNLATSAFYRPILVSEFLADRETFSNPANELKGLAVVVVAKRRETKDDEQSGGGGNQTEPTRIYKVTGLSPEDEPIEKLSFQKKIKDEDGKFKKDENGNYVQESKQSSIAEYLKETYVNAPIPGRRAVNVAKSPAAPPIWFAQEQLRIVPYQVYKRPVPDKLTASMVNQAARPPVEARKYIEGEGLETLGFTNTQTGTGGIDSSAPIHIEPFMLKVPYNILPIPLPRYGGGTPKQPFTRWKIPTTGFYRTNRQKDPKCMFIVGPGAQNIVDLYAQNIASALKNCGMTSTAPHLFERIYIRRDTDAELDGALADAKKRGAFLVIFAMGSKSVSTYSIFKDLADRKYGLQTVCLAQKVKNMNDYMQNVSMKFNLKLGGINHSVDTVQKILSNDTMVLGADVVHAGSGSFPGTPSIAGIVGSVDNTGGKFLGSVRLQLIEQDDKEIIYSVETMVYERLQDWQKINKKLPTNIIYYRDGVSAGQYDDVKAIEITAIRSAYHRLAQKLNVQTKVNITAVVVGKRHHTRFYMENGGNGDKWGNWNTLPGTCVDQLVTSPYYQNFFLQSHIGLKGTVKPAHYFVVVDEIPGMTLARLRDLTHGLCFSYVRATTGVSYAAPAYYADHLCERARLYVRKYYISDDAQLKAALDKKKKDLVDQYRKARESHKDKKGLEDRKRADTKAINKALNKMVQDRVEADFYKYNGGGGSGNPWQDRIAGTMFWM